MARAATTTDPYTAIAEPARRRLLRLLADNERPVGELVDLIGLDQPSVSKHLRVLREVGLVEVRRDGRRRLYRTDSTGLKSVHDWTLHFEKHWKRQLGRIKVQAELETNGESEKLKEKGDRG